MLRKKRFFCNICYMAQPQPKSSPLNELCSALPSLPMRPLFEAAASLGFFPRLNFAEKG
jgi:hypothetical protein